MPASIYKNVYFYADCRSKPWKAVVIRKSEGKLEALIRKAFKTELQAAQAVARCLGVTVRSPAMLPHEGLAPGNHRWNSLRLPASRPATSP